MNKLRSVFIVLLIMPFLFVCQSNADSNFIRVNLTKGVSAELPKNWSAMSDNRRITLETWKESVFQANKLSDAENDMPFMANYFDDMGNSAGTFSIRFYRTIKVTESEAIAGGKAFIKELDDGVKKNYTIGLETSGGKLVSWLGTTMKSINGSMYFISENRQITPRGDRFRGILVRYLNAGKSFTVLISYREDDAYLLKPICDRIISSIQH
jgi:hypothetical protein